ncbi:muramoyltetrapeptide carboxypeptidase [Bradymonas sediminis]|nr:muramoyltetrapeptide carboxypeptidase [Bradymonas sediminis]
MPPMIRPPALAQGSRLGVIATSSPINTLDDAVIAQGYRRLADLGLEVVEAPNCRKTIGHSAGTIEARVQAIHDFLRDPSINAIMAFWGGHQTHQLLEYLDFDLFAAHPKPIIGYSDLTPLLNVITARTGLVTFSGPAVISFAKPTLFEYTVRGLQRVLFEGGDVLDFEPAEIISTNLWYEHPDLRMVERPSDGWKTYVPGRARGRLFGGNIGSLLLLAGTPYWPDLDGAILFAEEDEGESPETVDRLFTRLRHMGVFDQIEGLVIGRFADSVEFTEEDSFTAILDTALRGYAIPTIYDVDFGHTDPLMTIPIGVEAELDATGKYFRLCQSWISAPT